MTSQTPDNAERERLACAAVTSLIFELTCPECGHCVELPSEEDIDGTFGIAIEDRFFECEGCGEALEAADKFFRPVAVRTEALTDQASALSRLTAENARLRDEARDERNAILHWIDSSDSDRFPNPPGVVDELSPVGIWRLAMDDLSMWLVEDIEKGRHRAALLVPTAEGDRG